MKKALVTGVCGFIGAHLAALLVEQGFEVLGVDMKEKSLNSKLNGYIGTGNVKIFKGDLLSFDFNSLGAVDYVYQIAGKVSAWGNIEDFDRINVDGTRRVIDYAKSAGSEVVVYLSSVAVYGYYGFSELPETGEKKPMQNPYSLSKLHAETMVMDYCKKIGQNFVVVRPGNVYGEHDMTSSYDLYRLVSQRKMAVVDKGRYKSCFVYAGNLVNGIYQASVTPASYNEDYNITDGYGETLAEYLTYAAKALGVKPKFMSLPSQLSRFTAKTIEGVYHLFKIKTMPLITLFSVEQNSHDYHFSIKKAEKKFGYSPGISLEEGTKRTADWFRTMPNNIKVKR